MNERAMKESQDPAAVRARLRRVAEVFAGRGGLGFSGGEDLERLWLEELGSFDVFSAWRESGGVRIRGLPPEKIYHVLASNLAISAETSLVLGLMLGSELLFKLPAAGLPDFEKTLRHLPPDLAGRVKLLKKFEEQEMKGCEGLVVFGSDETVEKIRGLAGKNQRCLYYGHRISLGILAGGQGGDVRWAERAAVETLAYDQAGCLSPRFYLAATEEEAAMFAENLAAALRKQSGTGEAEGIPFELAAQRRHARRMLLAAGAKLWQEDAGKGFTVALVPGEKLTAGPGNRFVQVAWMEDPFRELSVWKGSISALSLAAEQWPEAGEEWAGLAAVLGASRICRMGDLQNPPLGWRHDGRPRLADLVGWISMDV